MTEGDPDPSRSARAAGGSPRTGGAAPAGLLLTPLSPRGRAVLASLGFAAIALLGVADRATGADVRFYVLYWAPIATLAWACGRRLGYLAVALSTAASAVANGPQWAALHGYVLWWNLGVSLVSFVFLAFLVSTLRRLVDSERETARTDFLTALANSRALEEALDLELARSRRSRAPLTLAYVDIDDFKLVNDRLGHGTGDHALRELAHRLRSGVRALDLPARLGGDEFAVLFPETGAAEARVVVGRLRRRLADPLAGVGWPLSASIGVVTCPDGARSGDEVIRRADDLMYEAKQGGKNLARFGVLPPGPSAAR